MAITTAYLTVIIIWSTTPLAIQWSSNGVGYEFAVALRMLIGLSVLLIVTYVWRLPLPLDRSAFKVYVTGGIPLFLAMSSVYWSAQHIPSGWIAVLFGLTPLMTSLFARYLLQENSITREKVIGMFFGLAGLAIVFVQSLEFSEMAWLGVLGICFAACIHSLGAVLLKSLQPDMPSTSLTTGSLIIATPLFIINSLFSGVPGDIPDSSLTAIIYLALMGSALGFPLYYFCLKHLAPEKVALITLITPITALFLGQWLNSESLNIQTLIGSCLVLFGLAMYEYSQYLPRLKR